MEDTQKDGRSYNCVGEMYAQVGDVLVPCPERADAFPADAHYVVTEGDARMHATIGKHWMLKGEATTA